VIIFHAQRWSCGELQTQVPVDYEYWNKQGWLLNRACEIFTRVLVNPLYTANRLFVEFMAMRKIRKDYPAK